MTNYLRTDLDQLVSQGCHCPMPDRLRQRELAEEIPEVVRQGQREAPHRIVSEVVAVYPRPFDRVLPFLNPLLHGPSLVVEMDNILRSHREVRNDGADTGEELPAIPLHFRDLTPGLTTSCTLVLDVVVSNNGRLRRAARGSDKELLDLAPESVIRG